MNQKIVLVVLAIIVSFTFSGVAAAQSAATPGTKAVPKAKAQFKTAMAKMAEEIERSSLEIKKAEVQIQENIGLLREKSVSDIAYEDVFRMLEIQKVELTIELQGLEARMKLLKERAVNSSGENSGVVNTRRELLRRYVANQKKNMDRIQKLAKKGAVSGIEASRAENLLAEAQLRLQEFEAKAKETSPKYFEALFETSLAIAERKAKYEAVESLLSKHNDSRKQISKLDELMELKSAERARQMKLLDELRTLERSASEF